MAKRRGLRLDGHDYAAAGVYFVTICVHGRRPLFGRIANGDVERSPGGEMVMNTWQGLPQKFEGVTVDDSAVVMPDHLHGIIVLADDGPFTLSDVVGAFKSTTTLRYGSGVHEHGWPAFERRLWQRSYHEHIVRNDDSLREIREYITSNPLRWAQSRGTLTDVE